MMILLKFGKVLLFILFGGTSCLSRWTCNVSIEKQSCYIKGKNMVGISCQVFVPPPKKQGEMDSWKKRAWIVENLLD